MRTATSSFPGRSQQGRPAGAGSTSTSALQLSVLWASTSSRFRRFCQRVLSGITWKRAVLLPRSIPTEHHTSLPLSHVPSGSRTAA
eukprot:3377793-Prymnesium_polylepis.2